jgi:uncharacterized RDD family membrane protein YckC
MDWFYAQNNKQNGPVTVEALVSMLQQGHVQPTDLVWREGMGNWQPAGMVPELSAAMPAPGATLSYLNPGVGPTGAPVYAGFWLRFAAVIIDGILLGVVGFVLNLVIGLQRPMFGARPGFGNPAFNLGLILSGTAVGIVLEWLYYALMETSKFQGTLGKMALGLIVTDLNGQPISFGRATGRNFGKLISRYFTLYIGFMMAGWTQQKQALHDMMAGCLVLRKP